MADMSPITMATQLATLYTQSAQDLLTTRTKAAQTMSSALTKLESALRSFETAVTGLSGKKGLLQYSASFSAGGIATATASGTAQPGSYAFFVEQLASAHQVAFEDLPALSVASAGPLTVQLADGTAFEVNLAAADQDGNGTLSQAEIARAINLADGNGGKVAAMVMSAGGRTQLVLSAGQTGAAGAISLDTSALPPSTFKDALAGGIELSAARDAIVWLGEQGSGLKMQQASNTFTSIPGVSVSFTRAMSAGEAPLTLTVAGDDGGTAGNVASFVDAYNALMKVIDELSATGDAQGGTAAAAFATDTGVRTLRNRLNAILRQDFGGLRLMDLGVSADRKGVLSLDRTKLAKRLETNPDALDQVFGSASLTASSGVLGAAKTYLDSWLNVTSGQIQRRQATVQAMQKALSVRQIRLDDQYNSAYERYLRQFSQLQALMSQMSETSSIFDGLGMAGAN